jgi:microcompartment protein CcmK/EutM
MKRTAILSTVLMLGTAGCGDVFDSGNQKIAADAFSTAVEVTAQTRLLLEGRNGNIRVSGVADADSVIVEARLEVRAGTVEEAQAGLEELDVDVEATGSAISVTTIQPLDTEGRTFVVDYEITVPDGLEVSILNANGNVRVESIVSNVSVGNGNGNIVLLDIAGSAFANVANGEVDARVTLPSGAMVGITIGNGNAGLFIPSNTSAQFSATVGNGNIAIVNLDLQNMVSTSRRVTGRLGAGDGSINLQTGNGNITATGF